MQERSLPLYANLTDEQRDELEDLRSTLREDNATHEEIQEAINEKLREYGIDVPTRDEMLTTRIERTTTQLEILERQKELRDQGYEWDEIKDIIAEEFDVESLHAMAPQPLGRFHGAGPHRGRDDGSFEESENSET
jgi:DNA-binding transcriptional MerR regulator